MVVEVVFAACTPQILISVPLLEVGVTAWEVIISSGIRAQVPELRMLPKEQWEGRVGIFGEVVSLDTKLKSGDRLEIYQELLQNPKESRRLKAKDLQRKKAQVFNAKKHALRKAKNYKRSLGLSGADDPF